MKTLTDLTAAPIESDYREPPIFHFSYGEEPAPGCRRSVRLGPAGLLFTNGVDQVAIPMAELWSLAGAHEPNLVPVGRVPSPGAEA